MLLTLSPFMIIHSLEPMHLSISSSGSNLAAIFFCASVCSSLLERSYSSCKTGCPNKCWQPRCAVVAHGLTSCHFCLSGNSSKQHGETGDEGSPGEAQRRIIRRRRHFSNCFLEGRGGGTVLWPRSGRFLCPLHIPKEQGWQLVPWVSAWLSALSLERQKHGGCAVHEVAREEQTALVATNRFCPHLL